MPKIQSTNLPPALRQHLFERLEERKITVADLYTLKLWREVRTRDPRGDVVYVLRFIQDLWGRQTPKAFLRKGQIARGELL